MRRVVLLTLSVVVGITLMSCQPQANQPPTNENKMATASPEARRRTAAYDAEAVANRIRHASRGRQKRTTSYSSTAVCAILNCSKT